MPPNQRGGAAPVPSLPTDGPTAGGRPAGQLSDAERQRNAGIDKDDRTRVRLRNDTLDGSPEITRRRSALRALGPGWAEIADDEPAPAGPDTPAPAPAGELADTPREN